jgi:hypothetical protein
MNVLQKTGRKQEALPFRVNERNGDISTVRPGSLWQIVEELLRFTAQFFAGRRDPLSDFIWPFPEPFEKGVEDYSENNESYEEKYKTEGLTNQPPD